MTFILPSRDDDPICFFHILGIVTPTDFHSMIFQRGRAQPPTRLLLTIINHIIAIILTIINSILTTLINHQPGMAARYQNAASLVLCIVGFRFKDLPQDGAYR